MNVVEDQPDTNAYYLDDEMRVWVHDPVEARWWSPFISGLTCTWSGVVAHAGPMREATPEERAEIDREVFS